jgi:hypothetical protein
MGIDDIIEYLMACKIIAARRLPIKDQVMKITVEGDNRQSHICSKVNGYFQKLIDRLAQRPGSTTDFMAAADLMRFRRVHCHDLFLTTSTSINQPREGCSFRN